MTTTTKILVINPNSSQSITDGLQASLDPIKPPGVELIYLTGSEEQGCPASIDGALGSIQSANGVFRQLTTQGNEKDEGKLKLSPSSSSPLPTTPTQPLEKADAILICCFSDHPLSKILREKLPSIPCMHILESSINFALSITSKPFAIITTGIAMVPDIDQGVLNYLGGTSIRYAGCLATNLGVLELREKSSRAKVEQVIRSKVVELGQKGVGAIILGCAGMAGMEPFIRSCLVQSIGEHGANQVAIIDGARAGVHLLAGLARCKLTA